MPFLPLRPDLSAAPRRAVVLGAGHAGLLAARVLAGHFDEVLLLERRSPPPSAPEITAEVRALVLALPGVRLLSGVQAIAPRCCAGRVTAARWRPSDEESEHEVPAALVVDCTGRHSHTPRWLNEWGYGAPVEERVQLAGPRHELPHATRPRPAPCLQRRRYERVRHLPAGLLVMGEAIACLDPLPDSGLAMAEDQALMLQAELRRGEAGLARRFFRDAACAIEPAWQRATAGPSPRDSGSAAQPRVRRLAGAWLRRLREAAAGQGLRPARALP